MWCSGAGTCDSIDGAAGARAGAGKKISGAGRGEGLGERDAWAGAWAGRGEDLGEGTGDAVTLELRLETLLLDIGWIETRGECIIRARVCAGKVCIN